MATNADPFADYAEKITFLRVGTLNSTMNDETIDGFQRDRGRRGRPPARLKTRIQGLKRKSFDPRVFTPRIVSDRGDGTYFPVDGNASNHWVEENFGPNTRVPCIVLTGLTRAEEADLFDKAQNNKPVTKAKQREAAVAAGDELATKLTEILAEYGYEIGTGRKAGNFGWSAIEYLHEQGGEMRLRRVLDFIRDHFNDDPHSTNVGFVKALSDLMGNEEAAVSDRLLAAALHGTTVAALIEGASGGGALTNCLRNMKSRYHEYASS